MKGLNVLSTFDGKSCGRQALKNLNIKVNHYFSSEIDKSALMVARKNHPDNIEVGDVTKIHPLNRRLNYNDDLYKIDLLIGGSPCQGFSFAGKQLNFDDPRSKLFFEFVRLKNDLKPKYFLLENVNMKQGFKDIISEMLDVEPVEINSNLFSAQNRRRLYWTNIPLEPILVKPFEIAGPLLSSILEKSGTPITYSSSGRGNGKVEGRYNIAKKSCTLTATGFTTRASTFVADMGDSPTSPEEILRLVGHNGVLNSRTYEALFNDQNWPIFIRHLTPKEWERLQTLPDDYTKLDGLSDSQRKKMIGNGWTIKVIEHIFKGLPNGN